MAKLPAVLEDEYEFEYDVGMWSYGALSVYKQKSGGKLRTCKSVPKSLVSSRGGEVAQLKQLSALNHQHICSVTDAMEDRQKFYIMGDFVQGGELSDWAERLTEHYVIEEQTCAAYMRQALLAIIHAHSFDVYHGALLPSSLSLSSKMPDATIKVSDFGLASILDPEGTVMQRNRSPYTAPEILSGECPYVDAGSDMYSLGAIAHALLVGSAPGSNAKGSGHGLFSMRSSKQDEAEWAERSALARDFVNKLIAPWDERLTPARALQHPWVKDAQPLSVLNNSEAQADGHYKQICYLIALFLVPVTLPYRDFEQLRERFESSDTDTDGLITRLAARKILRERCPVKEAVDAALAIADIYKSDVFDLCAVACADVIATQFFAAGPTSKPLKGPFGSKDLLPRMLKKFFEVFGGRQQSVNLSGLKARLRTATLREVESTCGVDYEEIMADFPDGAIDAHTLQELLGENDGRGTPLGQDDESPKKKKNEGFFGMGFLGLFQQCMVPSETERDAQF
jgi:hypothetical protein